MHILYCIDLVEATSAVTCYATNTIYRIKKQLKKTETIPLHSIAKKQRENDQVQAETDHNRKNNYTKLKNQKSENGVNLTGKQSHRTKL